jgi:hypothetical protein
MRFVHNRTERILDIRRNILVFGNSAILGELAADLRASPLLYVTEHKGGQPLDTLRPDVVLVDAAQVQPEQFRELISLCPTILSLDPVTHHLTVLSSPHQADLTETARMIEMISITLHQPV